MRALPAPDRKRLESAVLNARRASERACRDAIDELGVFADKRPDHLDTEKATLRIGLRAKWRQLDLDRELLVAECAYEQWHRLLFARFLAENNLLLHPQYEAPVTLADCAELAAELGEPDAWSVAARFASEILPGIFRLDDPCVRLRLAPEGRHALVRELDKLPIEVFRADDSLGWVYQYWRKDEKDEVNNSERKIGGADLGPVTQLFTENYIVRFLLENSLGAWWAAHNPNSPLVKDFEYLRTTDEGLSVAGSFESWPKHAAEVTVMDPCCGSGHFLVEAFSMLWQMRAEEEGLSPADAQDAVLRYNLFGLELDPRCVQLAMFAVVLQAWKTNGRWRRIPVPNIVCSGIPVRAPFEEWTALAGADQRLEGALVQLHVLFRDAETLGSLIDPRRAVERQESRQHAITDVKWEQLAPLLEQAVEKGAQDPAGQVLGSSVSVIARAANYLSRQYTLVATNPPFLGKGKHQGSLIAFLKSCFAEGRQDLATTFAQRATQLCIPGGMTALVLPQNWLVQASYKPLRAKILTEQTIRICAILGEEAFESFGVRGPRTMLIELTNKPPELGSKTAVLDVSSPPGREQILIPEKILRLKTDEFVHIAQLDHSLSPSKNIAMIQRPSIPLLSEFARAYQGLKTGDNFRFIRNFWELPAVDDGWAYYQGASEKAHPWKGRGEVLWWQGGAGGLASSAQARVQGQGAWTKRGVIIREMRDLNATLYAGDIFQSNGIAVIPKLESDLPAIWSFLSSPEYSAAVRAVDSKLGIATSSAVAVPFHAAHWRQVAEERGDFRRVAAEDPTQWLFEGRPEVSTAALQVAVGRLVGYSWPEPTVPDELDAFTDNDGIVCIPAVAGEARAADRVQQLLAAAYGGAWSPAKLKELLEQAGNKKKLAGWLRDEFFKQHCALFHNRPFVWHIWDGLKDGFSALVNYHMLDRKTLAKLTYSYLGQDWVERQRAEIRDEVPGAEARLRAAQGLKGKLELILDGEDPYDIFVRWKQPHEQPIGWEPDLNDGVRLNIRPFVTAGALRFNPNIKWGKDRGKNPDGSERLNDIHLTIAEKQEARKRAGQT